jgi:hypothetical protein
MDKSILCYAKMWNRTFARHIISLLPNELRCMLYANIWTEPYITEACEYIHYTLQGRKDCPRPHFIDALFVGPQMALEIVAAFYANVFAQTPASRVDDLSHIPNLVYDDIFQVGLRTDTALRRLDIRLDLDGLNFQDLDTGRLEWQMRPLCNIKTRNFELNLTLSHSSIQLSVLEKVFDSLRPVLTICKSKGMDVNIFFYDWDSIILRGDELILEEYKLLLEHQIYVPDAEWKSRALNLLDDVSTIYAHVPNIEADDHTVV